MRLSAALSLAIFVAAGVVLIGAVPTLFLITTRATRTAHSAVAAACSERVAAVRESAELPAVLESLRVQYALRSISVGSEPVIVRSDVVERRPTPYGPVVIVFADDAVSAGARSLRMTIVAALAAALAGLVGITLHTVRLSRAPAADAPARAAIESRSLFQTFELSVRSMQGRERELQRLRDEAKERAAELEMVSGTLVRSLTSGFISTDERGLLLEMNQTARELLGVAASAAVRGRSVREALGDRPFSRELQRAVEGRTTLQRMEITDAYDDGNVIGLSTVPLVDETGRYFGLLALFTDLTLVRRLEGRVREMQSLADLGEMAAGIAHEFRNSLATVLGYIRLARKEPPSAEQRLAAAEQEARSLTDAVEKLLAFTRPLSLDETRVDLREPIEAVVERFEVLNPGVRFTIEGGPAVIQGDIALLTRAFENVIRNAVDAIAETGRAEGNVRITIRAEPEPQVVVDDDGVGIDESDAARLLLPFQSRKAKGFGLGLALVRKIVLFHGGSVRLGSSDEGARVTLDFPRAPGEG